MRVTHVTLVRSDGGVPAYLAPVLADQLARGWQVELVAPLGSHVLRAADSLGSGLAVHAVSSSFGPLALARTALTIRRRVTATAPDLVHVHSSHAGVVARAILATVRRGPPVVFQPHAWSFLALGGLARRLAVGGEWLLDRCTTLVVCGSADELAEGRSHGLAKRAEVVVNAVDLGRFAPVDAAERRARKESLGLDGDAPVAVCVARLAEQKGHRTLLAAWAKVATEVPTATLVLVGSGPLEAELRSLGTPNVMWMGARRDPEWFHALADLGVLASSYETMALSILESLACGTPVVCTAAHGSAEAVGDAGAVVPVGDANRLADQIVEALLDDRPLRTEARRRAVQRFGVDRLVSELAAVSLELARSVRTPA